MKGSVFLNELCKAMNDVIVSRNRHKHIFIAGSAVSINHTLQTIWYRYVLPTLDPSYDQREYIHFNGDVLVYENRNATINWLLANGIHIHLFDLHAAEVIELPKKEGERQKYEINPRTTAQKIKRFKDIYPNISTGSIFIIENDPFGKREDFTAIEQIGKKCKCDVRTIIY